MKRQCPACGKIVAITVRGTFRNHKSTAGVACEMGETPSNGAKAPLYPVQPGYYWVPLETSWVIAYFNDELQAWEILGGGTVSFGINTWRGPIAPPREPVPRD